MDEQLTNRTTGSGAGEAACAGGSDDEGGGPPPHGGTARAAVEALAGGREPELSFHSLPAMRYPVLYVWFVVVSSADIVLTWLVLGLGGREINPVAAAVIDHWGLPGAIAFKFSLMLMVIVLCEVIGRTRDSTARRLAGWSVGVSALAPVYTIVLVGAHLLGWT